MQVYATLAQVEQKTTSQVESSTFTRLNAVELFPSASHLGTTYWRSERVNLFYKASTKLQRKLGVNFNKAMSSSPASDVLNWVSETKLMRKLIGCKKGLCDFKTAKEICEGFISFDKPIYLHQALKIVNVLISKINTKKAVTKNKKKSTEKAQKVESFSESVLKDAKKANQYYEQLDLGRILSSIQRFMTAKDKKLFRILVNASQKTTTQKKLF